MPVQAIITKPKDYYIKEQVYIECSCEEEILDVSHAILDDAEYYYIGFHGMLRKKKGYSDFIFAPGDFSEFVNCLSEYMMGGAPLSADAAFYSPATKNYLTILYDPQQPLFIRLSNKLNSRKPLWEVILYKQQVEELYFAIMNFEV